MHTACESGALDFWRRHSLEFGDVVRRQLELGLQIGNEMPEQRRLCKDALAGALGRAAALAKVAVSFGELVNDSVVEKLWLNLEHDGKRISQGVRRLAITLDLPNTRLGRRDSLRQFKLRHAAEHTREANVIPDKSHASGTLL